MYIHTAFDLAVVGSKKLHGRFFLAVVRSKFCLSEALRPSLALLASPAGLLAVVRIKVLPLCRLVVGCAPWAVRLLAVSGIKVWSVCFLRVGCATRISDE